MKTSDLQTKWQSMTQEEQNAWMAEVRGEKFRVYNPDRGWHDTDEPVDWSPVTDENHFRQVLEVVMKDEELWDEYVVALKDIYGCRMIDYHECLKAALPQRCEALYIAKNLCDE